MIKIEKYDFAFEQYINMAKQHPGVLDVIQCGKVNNLGVSDIDVLLIIDNWKNFIPSIKLLNPEIISPLFTHGPFLCEKSDLSDLQLFTTLRNIHDNNIVSPEISKDDKMISVLIRQTRCFLHFLNVTLNHNNSRQILLICNSLVHSFKDLESLEWYADIDGRYSAFSKELSVLRQEMQNGYTPSKKAVVIIIKDFHELVLLGVKIVSKAIKEQLSINKINFKQLSDVELILWFEMQIRNGNFANNNIDSNFIDIISCWKIFYEKSISGYVSSNSLWMGGEFLFFNIDAKSTLGWRIWLRRLIKFNAKIYCKYFAYRDF